MENFISRAEQLFLSIINSANPYDIIIDMVQNEKRQEDDVLEYKTCYDRNPNHVKSRLKNDRLRQKCSLHYTAFANTEGGVLIWGIKCQKKQLPELDIIDDVSELFEDLNKAIVNSSDPPLKVVMNKVTQPHNDNSGFIVCYIPESKHKPHRATDAKQCIYPMRVGDNAELIPHSFLKLLFHPFGSPCWDVSCTHVNAFRNSENIEISLEISILNKSVITAENVAIRLASTTLRWTTMQGTVQLPNKTQFFVPIAWASLSDLDINSYIKNNETYLYHNMCIHYGLEVTPKLIIYLHKDTEVATIASGISIDIHIHSKNNQMVSFKLEITYDALDAALNARKDRSINLHGLCQISEK